MYNDSANANDTTNSKRTDITHEDLSWESIIPQKAHHGTDKRTKEYYKFLAMRDIHDVKI